MPDGPRRGRSGAAGATGGKGERPRRGWRRRGPKQRGQRVAQLRAAYVMAQRVDPKIGLYVGLAGLGTFLVFLLVGLLLDAPVFLGLLGLLTALTVMALVFSRRAQRAAYTQIEGQPGAAASVLQSMKGWTITPAVAVGRNREAPDVVHRAVGRPGVLLLGEGNPVRVAPLVAQERKRLARLVPDVPVYDYQVGAGEGQLPLGRLQRELTKLPRNLAPGQVAEVERRLRAVGSAGLPVPKGPLPRNARMPRPPRGPRS